ncbi:SH3 domain-containing protein [Oceanicola sp. 502str15]|uniref:SH3 domain-containing protein n=1 Tax=Oceanicola sp. 502str15 TaxID=2696061 RepID=UPI002094E317|nr:SH3 domain-containing protein [Oceanicola sp. 502str15]MCO6383931.1 SH3 domain-containing protein [Oceanicola sp. 502str15]
MTRRLFLALATLLALALPAAAQTLYVQESDDGYLNLRNGPGTRHEILMRLTSGTAVEVTDSRGNWRQVILPDGTRGWAHRRYMAPQYIATQPYSFAVLPTDDGFLNLRRGPGVRFDVIRRLYAGQMLHWDDGREGSWVQLRLPDGTVGWASMTYLTAVN